MALVVRGDHRLNAIKASKLPGMLSPLVLAEAAEVKAILGAGFGSLGPVELPVRIIVDHTAAMMSSFVCGANEDDYHSKRRHLETGRPPLRVCGYQRDCGWEIPALVVKERSIFVAALR